MSVSILDHLRTIDPEYGHRPHQREFLRAMTKAQELNPCTKDHSAEKWPCHTHKCYPKDRSGRTVGA